MNKQTHHHTHPRTFAWFLCLLLHAVGMGAASAQVALTPKEKPITGYIVPITVEDGVSLPTIRFREVFLYAPMTFRSEQERIRYTRLVHDVKRVLPYAKIVSGTLKETYEYIETIPDEGEKMKHLKRMERDLYKQYSPELRKLTLRQGKLLMKLIVRETNSSSYQLIEAFLGGFTAGFWNTFAKIFGTTLKTTWDPEGEDAAIERVCVQIEYGLI